MRRQVAEDISISINESSITLHDPGDGFYYVCGISTLNRPGDGPLALNHVQQRFITTVSSAGRGGGTLFDGSVSPEGRADFQSEWSEKCPNNNSQKALNAQSPEKTSRPPSREVVGLTLGQTASIRECAKEKSYGYIHYVTIPTDVPCWRFPISETESLTLPVKESIAKDGRFMIELGSENVPKGVLPMADIEVIGGNVEEINLKTFGASHQSEILELLEKKWGQPSIDNSQENSAQGIEAQWLFNDFVIAFIGIMNKRDEGAIIFRSEVAAEEMKRKEVKHSTSF